MDFWVSGFILEDYAIYVGMDVQILSFWKSIFRSTLDGEIKQLNATGNYINKKEA